MVIAAIFSILLFKIGLKIDQIFIVVSLMNLGVFGIYIFKNPRDFYISFFDILIRTFYKVEVKNPDNIPQTGPVIIASNHVSFIDPLILTVCVNRPPIFIMDQSYFDIKLLQWFYRSAKAIPITPKKICPDGLEKAMTETVKQLEKGELVAVFPEGFITKDGNLLKFKDGVKRLGNQVHSTMVVPVAISGMWGSWFSRHKKEKAMNGFPRRRNLRTKIKISIGTAAIGAEIQTENLQNQVLNLRGNLK